MAGIEELQTLLEKVSLNQTQSDKERDSFISLSIDFETKLQKALPDRISITPHELFEVEVTTSWSDLAQAYEWSKEIVENPFDDIEVQIASINGSIELLNDLWEEVEEGPFIDVNIRGDFEEKVEATAQLAKELAEEFNLIQVESGYEKAKENLGSYLIRNIGEKHSHLVDHEMAEQFPAFQMVLKFKQLE